MKDDFWDIDKLLPHKITAAPPVPPVPPVPRGIGEVKEISDGAAEEKSVYIHDILSADNSCKEREILDYSDKSNIVKSVIIYDWSIAYTYNNDFSKSAHRVHGMVPTEMAEFVPFFSYFPQYSDMSEAQYKRYLWWRESVRKGDYLKTDTSYIFLYIYELLALDDVIVPSDTLDIIFALWSAYCENHPEISKYLFDWTVDYALIHNIRIPFEKLSGFLPFVKLRRQSILYNMYFFDYLFADAERLTDRDIVLLCEVLSNYNPFKSKSYADEDYKKRFDSCLKPILAEFIRVGFFGSDGPYLKRNELKISHPSYLSAICSAETKKNLTVTYYPCISNELIRTAFSNIIKHIENKVRASLGIRHRLSNIVLPDEMREIIDSYMDGHFPPAAKLKAAPIQPEEKAREPKKIEVNLARAKEIEDLSWQTTEKLTQGLEIEEETEPPQLCEKSKAEPPPVPTEGEACFADAFSDCEKTILKLMLKSADIAELEHAARENEIMLDAAIDSINEKALEYIGDTLINTADYTLIPDYIDELSVFDNV